MSVSIRIDGRVAVVEIDNPPVNAAGHGVRRGLMDALAQTERAPVDAVLLVCAGRTFVAGADIREFGKPPQEPSLPDVVTALEGATKPWIAAIHGTALGGGMEIALGCAYRVAASEARLGLPEVTLGLIPGAGGTVRLPRLIGPVAALEVIASGKPLGAARAHALGLVDAVVEGDLRDGAMAFARTAAARPMPPPLTARPVPDAPDLDAAIQRVTARAGSQEAPRAVCEAVRHAVALPAARALEEERAIFARLRDGAQSKALRHVFFAERAVGRDLTGPARSLHRIGIVGGGTMGAGITAACLLADLPATLVERDTQALEAGLARVHAILGDSLKRGLIDADRHAALLGALTGATDIAALSQADLVIEAVFEDMDAKRAVFADLGRATRPDAVLATNTSYLDVGAIARAVADPARVIGLHFFSPAHVMKLMELVTPPDAAPVAIATGAALGKRLGKVTVPAGVCDGFIANRIMAAYRARCETLLEDGASPQQIDAAMRAFGFPMGLFEMQDLAGLDIAWAMRRRRAATRDPGLRYGTVPDRLCEAGRLGRKAGRGWYLYEAGRALPDPEVDAIISAEAARNGITRGPVTDAQIIETILSTMQAEGAAILDEGIAASADAIDVAMIHGFRFPRWLGGPMYLAAQA